MKPPTIIELLLRKVIRDDQNNEVYNKMTDLELEDLEEERKMSRIKDPEISQISQDIDCTILYDVFKIGLNYEEEKKKFRKDSFDKHSLEAKRYRLLMHINQIYKKYEDIGLPLKEDRQYITNTFELINQIDEDLKNI